MTTRSTIELFANLHPGAHWFRNFVHQGLSHEPLQFIHWAGGIHGASLLKTMEAEATDLKLGEFCRNVLQIVMILFDGELRGEWLRPAAAAAAAAAATTTTITATTPQEEESEFLSVVFEAKGNRRFRVRKLDLDDQTKYMNSFPNVLT